jgi:predicted transcriptional regulator of viral defense system
LDKIITVRTDSKRRAEVQRILEERGVVTNHDIKHLGFSVSYLADLSDSGLLQRLGRGIYTLPTESNWSSHRSKVEVAARYPKGVLCLLTALAYHDMGTQLPPSVWIAIPPHAWAPKIATVPIEVVRMKPELLEVGVDEHVIEGVSVRITSPARTVVDCFKFRSRVGTDVAFEALKDGLARRRFTSDELYGYATMEHVWSVIRPYAEAIS